MSTTGETDSTDAKLAVEDSTRTVIVDALHELVEVEGIAVVMVFSAVEKAEA